MSYSMIKPAGGSLSFYETKHGAHYMVSGSSGTVNTYKTASAVIILPTLHRLKGTGNGRNAFISFGASALETEGAVDIGLRNRGLDGGGDDGFGWHPYCVECKADKGYYYDGRYNPNQVTQDAYYAPPGTKRARVTVTPNLTYRNKIRLSVEWLDDYNRVIDSSKNFDREITLSKTYTWANFYRFASLVPYPYTTVNTDSTYMTGGVFENVRLGSSNWGISSNLVNKAYIVYPPKCSLPNGHWSTGEEFKIDHWA